jgi:hypothetical protein
MGGAPMYRPIYPQYAPACMRKVIYLQIHVMLFSWPVIALLVSKKKEWKLF